MEQKMGKLVIVRHGESEWNIKGIWTGITDVHLSEHGYLESKKIGELIRDLHFDQIIISTLVRTKETLEAMEETNDTLKKVPIIESYEIRERDYGDYTGKNKWEMRDLLGEEKFKEIRRSWDGPIPNGESLKMVYERTIPYFLDKILPILKDGKNVLIVAHGNSIRSIVKYIENISDTEIPLLEIPFEEVLIYDLDTDGHILQKEIRSIDSHPDKKSKYNNHI